MEILTERELKSLKKALETVRKIDFLNIPKKETKKQVEKSTKAA